MNDAITQLKRAGWRGQVISPAGEVVTLGVSLDITSRIQRLEAKLGRLVDEYNMSLPTILEAGVALLEELEYDACVAAAEENEMTDRHGHFSSQDRCECGFYDLARPHSRVGGGSCWFYQARCLGWSSDGEIWYHPSGRRVVARDLGQAINENAENENGFT